MPEKLHHLSLEQYQRIITENQDHGRTACTDLYVVEMYGNEIFVRPPLDLPKAVQIQPFEGIEPIMPSDRLPISVEETRLHRNRIHYERIYDEQRRLHLIHRLEEGQGTDSLPPVRTHYHVSSVAHDLSDLGFGQPVVGLGDQIMTFDEFFDAIHLEILKYRGEFTDPPPTSLQPPRPDADLGVPTLKAYIFGIREAAQRLRRDDLIARTNQALDQLPVSLPRL